MNPIYILTVQDDARYVLRKKPPMKLVSKKTHWIERIPSHRLLKDTGVPVPRLYQFCRDESVIGTPFYLMEYLDGRIFEGAYIVGVSAEERREM